MKKASQSTIEEEKREAEELVGREMMKEKLEAIERDIEKVKKNNKTHQNQVFALKKLVSGGPANFQPEAIMDPKSKELLVNKNEILQATLEFSSGILQNNNPVEEFVDHFEALR